MKQLTGQEFLETMQAVVAAHKTGSITETEAKDIGTIILNLRRGKTDQAWEKYGKLKKYLQTFMIEELRDIFYKVEKDGIKLGKTYSVNNIDCNAHKFYIGEKVKITKITKEDGTEATSQRGIKDLVEMYHLDNLTRLEKEL